MLLFQSAGKYLPDYRWEEEYPSQYHRQFGLPRCCRSTGSHLCSTEIFRTVKVNIAAYFKEQDSNFNIKLHKGSLVLLWRLTILETNKSDFVLIGWNRCFFTILKPWSKYSILCGSYLHTFDLSLLMVL